MQPTRTVEEIARGIPALAKQLCHPDRSEAQWRGLVFRLIAGNKQTSWRTLLKDCHSERSEESALGVNVYARKVSGRARLQPARRNPNPLSS